MLGILVNGIAVMLQTTIVGRVTLLHGFADLVMLTVVSWSLHEKVRSTWPWAVAAGLMVGWVSALPWWVPLAGYAMIAGMSAFLQSRLWQIPILSLFILTLAGTVSLQGSSYLVLIILGANLPLLESFNLILLPSLLLNFLLALPVYGLIGEVASWVNPKEIEA